MSVNMFTQNRGSHWYLPNGDSCHVQPDGKRTTLRHARKQGLLPSVTNIMSILPKHAVEDWRVEQAVLSTMQCMTEEGASASTAQEMLFKVSQRLELNTSSGRKFGTEMHSIIDHINAHASLPPEMSPLGVMHPKHAKAYLDWFNASDLRVNRVERSFTSVAGSVRYAGRMDLEAVRGGVPCIIDFKTQAVRDGKPKFYPEWSYQLAAYENGIGAAIISVVIDSGPDATITEYVWSEEEKREGFGIFHAAAHLWSKVKGYQP